MSFNWKNALGGILYFVPEIVQQVEHDHNDKGGIEKQKLARDLLLDGKGLATVLQPQLGTAIDAVYPAVNGIIDGVVAMFNAIGHFKHKDAPAKPADATPASGSTSQHP